MNEIEVVVDVRQSPDTAELIVVKQKLVSAAELQPSGPPVEMRLGLMTRKAEVSAFGFFDRHVGRALAARVKNVGMVPFEVDRVALVCEFEEPPDGNTRSGIPYKEIGQALDFILRDPNKQGPLQPGESREYYLPPELFDGVTLLCRGLAPSRYWLAAFSGPDEVGRLGGAWVAPFVSDSSGVLIHRRAQPLFDTLPERERRALISAVAGLRGVDREHWPSEQARPLEGVDGVYVVRVTPDLSVLVSQVPEKRVQITDIVRDAALDQFAEAEQGAAGQQ
jgi:hypothetical protein